MNKSAPFLETTGFCPTCDSETTFRSDSSWLRDCFVCLVCASIPRERALMKVLDSVAPGYEALRVHECAPTRPAGGASLKLQKRCAQYVETHFAPEVPRGELHPDGYRCEDLEALTFPDDSFDLHITQDVLEHVMNPAAAFSEIARTLAPGGLHVFTVPLVRKQQPTIVRARLDGKGEIEHLFPPEFHGSAIGVEGALVVHDWGYDIVDFIYETSGMLTTIWSLDDLSSGIRAEFIEVLVSRRPNL